MKEMNLSHSFYLLGSYFLLTCLFFTYHPSGYKRNPLSAKSSISPTKVSSRFPQAIKPTWRLKIHKLFTSATDGSLSSASELIVKKKVMDR